MYVKFNGSSRVLKAIGILKSVEITYNFRWNLERHLTLNFALVIVIVRVMPPRERRKRSTRVIFMFLCYDFNKKIMKSGVTAITSLIHQLSKFGWNSVYMKGKCIR